MTCPDMSIKVERKLHDMRILGRIVKVRSTKQSVRHLLTLISYNDTRVKRSKSRSCLHDKAFELGTRQTWGRSDLRSKSTDSECLQNCGSSLLRSNSWASVGGKRPFDPNIIWCQCQKAVHACMIRLFTPTSLYYNTPLFHSSLPVSSVRSVWS